MHGWRERERETPHALTLLPAPCPARTKLIHARGPLCSPDPEFCSPNPTATLSGIAFGALRGFLFGPAVTNDLSGCGVQVRTHVQALPPLLQDTKRSTIACIRDSIGCVHRQWLALPLCTPVLCKALHKRDIVFQYMFFFSPFRLHGLFVPNCLPVFHLPHS